jgi:ketosteroid isomerase-like protein
MPDQQELLDKLAIREVLERYMRYNDDRAAARIAELFDDDAVFQVMGNLIEGRAAIHAMFRGDAESEPEHWTEPGELLKQPGSLHLCANPIIDIDGDTATSELDFHVVARDENGRARTSLIGRYRDRLRRCDDGNWRITHRVGVSVARPGEAGTSAEWDRALAALPEEERSRFLT